MKSFRLCLIALFIMSMMLTLAYSVGRKNIAFRKQQCLSGKEKGGSPKWTDGIYYNSYAKKNWDRGTVCETKIRMKGKKNVPIFHDGCSGEAPGRTPDGKHWGEFFHNACVIHDHCYHHNPSTYNIPRERCDIDFKDDMNYLCKKAKDEGRFNNRQYGTCLRKANTQYTFVAAVSDLRSSQERENFYYAFDYQADYLSYYRWCTSYKRGDRMDKPYTPGRFENRKERRKK